MRGHWDSAMVSAIEHRCPVRRRPRTNPSPTPKIGSMVRQINRGGTRDCCFDPVATPGAEALILGSLPGRKSLEMQQYYAHPQNAFWRLITQILGAEWPLPYTRRVKLLTENRIALWDVLAAAERPGSLDSSIVHASALANDFAAFFRAHPQIRRVYFNGRKAEELYAVSCYPGCHLNSPCCVMCPCLQPAPPMRA